MRRSIGIFTVLAVAAFACAPLARAQGGQQWRPASTSMPAMPTMPELQGDWLRGVEGWFAGVERVAGVSVQALRATGNPRAGSTRAQVTRLMNGPVPVIVLTDRNGDDRADMVEIFHTGSLVAQVIDADYSGRANVIRYYDASGALLREERL
jgi:hypothetical protein